MIISNQANLFFQGGQIQSNVVQGEVVSPLSLSKVVSADSYLPNGQLQYTLRIANIAATAYGGLTVVDDLGQYDFMGFPRFPLAYVEGSVSLVYESATGAIPGTVTVDESQTGVRFTFDLPAGALAFLQYHAQVTPFAPLAAGSAVVNTAILESPALDVPLTAALTLPVAEQADLEIFKSVAEVAEPGQPFALSFTIVNYGNAPATDSEYTIVSDTLDPALTGIAVSANGIPWTNGVEYLYEEGLFYFQTQPGAVVLEVAEFFQDDFGRWNAQPSSLEITISGRVSQ